MTYSSDFGRSQAQPLGLRVPTGAGSCSFRRLRSVLPGRRESAAHLPVAALHELGARLQDGCEEVAVPVLVLRAPPQQRHSAAASPAAPSLAACNVSAAELAPSGIDSTGRGRGEGGRPHLAPVLEVLEQRVQLVVRVPLQVSAPNKGASSTVRPLISLAACEPCAENSSVHMHMQLQVSAPHLPRACLTCEGRPVLSRTGRWRCSASSRSSRRGRSRRR